VTDLAAGVDLSSHNPSARINYDALAKTHDFGIVRCAYGTRCDSECANHVRRLRDVGMAVGLYGFWRASQPTVDQYLTICEQADRVRLGPGDIVPSADIEDDGSDKVCPAWSDPFRLLCETLAGRWTGSMIYCSRRDWIRLGSPTWFRNHYSWPAHWAETDDPLTPGDWPWHIHQRRVGVMPGIHAGQLCQDVATLPLPTILDPDQERRRVEGVIATTLRSTGKPDA